MTMGAAKQGIVPTEAQGSSVSSEEGGVAVAEPMLEEGSASATEQDDQERKPRPDRERKLALREQRRAELIRRKQEKRRRDEARQLAAAQIGQEATAAPAPNPAAAREARLAARELRPAHPTPQLTESPVSSVPEQKVVTDSQVVAREAKTVVRELRRARAKRLAARLGVFVALPTALSAVYYGFIGANQYESFAMFSIHSVDARSISPMDSLLSMAGGGGGDTLAVRDYVLSRDMLARLDKEHGFQTHYRSMGVDWLSRLGADASFEDAYEYFGDKVAAEYDMTSHSVTLRVRAFSPEKASEFSRAILAYSEEMVNKLSERERLDGTQYAEHEVKKAEERLSKARKEVLAVQQKHAEFNPIESAGAALSLRTQLEGELAKARAQLMELKAFMNADAPQVQAAQQRVNSIAAQVSQESRRMVDPKEGGLNASMVDFDAAMTEKEFAQKAYESAMAALEMARAEAARQHRYLATIASPSKPDESTYPRRILGVLTVFVVSFLAMGIGILVGAAVREHAKL